MYSTGQIIYIQGCDLSGFIWISGFFLNDKVVLRIYFSSGKGRKLSLKKRKPVVLHRKKESGIICNLTVANGSLHVPIFLSILIVVDSF